MENAVPKITMFVIGLVMMFLVLGRGCLDGDMCFQRILIIVVLSIGYWVAVTLHKPKKRK